MDGSWKLSQPRPLCDVGHAGDSPRSPPLRRVGGGEKPTSFASPQPWWPPGPGWLSPCAVGPAVLNVLPLPDEAPYSRNSTWLGSQRSRESAKHHTTGLRLLPATLPSDGDKRWRGWGGGPRSPHGLTETAAHVLCRRHCTKLGLTGWRLCGESRALGKSWAGGQAPGAPPGTATVAICLWGHIEPRA